MHTRIKRCWRDLNLWLLQKNWQKPRIYLVTPTSLNRVQKNELKHRKLTNWRMLQILQHHLKKVPWAAKTLHCHIYYWKNIQSIVYFFENETRKPYNDKLYHFKALALHLHGNEVLETEIFKIFNLYLEKAGGTDLPNFGGVCMEKIPAVEYFVQAVEIFYNFDFVDGSMIKELAVGSARKYCYTGQQLRFNSHICSVSNINTLFKAYRRPPCDQFIKKAGNLEQPFAKKRKKWFSKKRYFNCEKHCLTN